MQKIRSDGELSEAIRQLEEKQADDEKKLKEQFYLAYESVRPVNLIKNTFREAAASRDLKDDMIKVSASLAAGYLFKTSFGGKPDVSMKKIVGGALLFGIANAVAKNPESVKSIGRGLLNMLRSRPDTGIDRSARPELKESK